METTTLGATHTDKLFKKFVPPTQETSNPVPKTNTMKKMNCPKKPAKVVTMACKKKK